MAPHTTSYRRILLKISGEMLMGGSQSFGIDYETCLAFAKIIQKIQADGFELGLVIGGGNIFRGINLCDKGMPRTPADQMGMLATLINGIALQEALLSLGCKAQVFSGLDCPKVAKSYHFRQAIEEISQGTVAIFVGGTGNPYFTTDTAAALRAAEIQAHVLLKATKEEGVYTHDPKKYPNAQFYKELSYERYLTEKLAVMDATAITLCMNNKIPILVFNMHLLGKETMINLLNTRQYGTLIKGE